MGLEERDATQDTVSQTIILPLFFFYFVTSGHMAGYLGSNELSAPSTRATSK